MTFLVATVTRTHVLAARARCSRTRACLLTAQSEVLNPSLREQAPLAIASRIRSVVMSSISRVRYFPVVSARFVVEFRRRRARRAGRGTSLRRAHRLQRCVHSIAARTARADEQGLRCQSRRSVGRSRRGDRRCQRAHQPARVSHRQGERRTDDARDELRAQQPRGPRARGGRSARLRGHRCRLFEGDRRHAHLPAAAVPRHSRLQRAAARQREPRRPHHQRQQLVPPRPRARRELAVAAACSCRAAVELAPRSSPARRWQRSRRRCKRRAGCSRSRASSTRASRARRSTAS